MRYFKYQYSNSMGEVWGLFSELSELSNEEILNKNKKFDYSHTTEIINSAMNKLDRGSGFDLNSFDLKAYEYECYKKDDIKLGESRKKYLTIVDTVNGSEDDVVGYGEISANDSRLQSIEDAFALFDDNDEFERYLAELYNIRKDYIISKGIDPVEMILNSLKGIPEAVSLMANLVLEDTFFKQIVEGLCKNSVNNLQYRLEGAY